jgi:hypothetical protein
MVQFYDRLVTTARPKAKIGERAFLLQIVVAP